MSESGCSSRLREHGLEEMRHIVREGRQHEARRGEQNPDQPDADRRPCERDHAGDHGGRTQHDSDLEGRRGKFEIVVFVELKIALFLFLQRAPHQLHRSLALAVAGLRLGAVARRGLLPLADLLAERGLAGLVRRGCGFDLGGLALHQRERAANGLRLHEIPQIRGFDLKVQRLRLRGLAEGLGEREEQRQHRDDQRDLLVVSRPHAPHAARARHARDFRAAQPLSSPRLVDAGTLSRTSCPPQGGCANRRRAVMRKSPDRWPGLSLEVARLVRAGHDSLSPARNASSGADTQARFVGIVRD